VLPMPTISRLRSEAIQAGHNDSADTKV
jgi:hypothetical protein